MTALEQRSTAAGTAQPATSAARSATRRRARTGRWWVPWAFLAPALILFVYFKFIPMGQALVMSFQDVRPYLGSEWVGLENYSALFATDEFGTAAWQTGVIAVAQISGGLLLGFALALLLEGRARRLWFIRSAAFLPVVVPVAVVAELWRIIYHPTEDGVANGILGWFLIEPSQWINSPDSSMLSVIIVGIWRDAPYNMIIIIAGLVGVDRSLYESASLDGAGWLGRIRYVTLPALRPVIAILVTLAAIRGMRIFTEVFLLTNGGPNGSTEVLMTLIYRMGFERIELGVAAASSVVLLVGTIVLTLVVRAVVRRKDA